MKAAWNVGRQNNPSTFVDDSLHQPPQVCINLYVNSHFSLTQNGSELCREIKVLQNNSLRQFRLKVLTLTKWSKVDEIHVKLWANLKCKFIDERSIDDLSNITCERPQSKRFNIHQFDEALLKWNHITSQFTTSETSNARDSTVELCRDERGTLY